MGTPEFAVPSLARLVSDGHQVVAVFTQPDKPAGRGKQLHEPPVKRFALDRHLTLYQPAKLKTNEEVRATFARLDSDACIVAAYGKILPQWLLDIPRLGCINVHASLLPEYRGAAPINWAIAHGERATGVTIMQMDAGMDTGPMIAKRALEIGADETAPELTARLAALGAELLSETLPLIQRGAITPLPQANAEATYAPILKREDGLIDWQLAARDIGNRVRAFQPWPGVYTTLRNARLNFWRAREVAPPRDGNNANIAPGTITALDPAGIVVACAGQTALRVEELQIEGKRRMSARDFINGMRLHTGDRITDAQA